MNHTYFPHKLLITVYYNSYKHTHKIKNKDVKRNDKKIKY